jgi:replicative DNA helicase
LDLKESGDIENHANVFWSIHRKNLQDQDRVPVEFMLPKRRDGRWNIFHDYWFFPNHQRFDARCTSPGGMEAGGK